MYLSIKYTGLRHGLEEGVNRKELMHVTYRFLASTVRWVENMPFTEIENAVVGAN